MKILKTIGLASALMAGTAFSYQASAVTVNFADPSWAVGGSTSSTSQSLGGVTVTVSSLPTGTSLTWATHDGFGVTKSGDTPGNEDEINHRGDGINEQLLVSFGQAVNVTSLRLSDFFTDTSGQHQTPSDDIAEISYNGGGSFASFIATQSNAGDPYTDIASSASGITSILFQSGNPDIGSGYSIAGLDFNVAPVPLPPAVWLLGSAMVFLFRKRQDS